MTNKILSIINLCHSIKRENILNHIYDFNLYNSKTNTIGSLKGKITHNKFKNWLIDLKIDTENLLILDTDSKNDPVYFGKGFLSGYAKIFGPGENLLIDLKGATNKGTFLTIPIKKSINTGDLSYLNFVNNSDKNNKNNIKRFMITELISKRTHL